MRICINLAAVVRRDALETLTTLLPEDDGEHREREGLQAAQHDRVASKDPVFQVDALVGALARIVAAQQQEIDKLKRTKANATTLASKADKE